MQVASLCVPFAELGYAYSTEFQLVATPQKSIVLVIGLLNPLLELLSELYPACAAAKSPPHVSAGPVQTGVPICSGYGRVVRAPETRTRSRCENSHVNVLVMNSRELADVKDDS